MPAPGPTDTPALDLEEVRFRWPGRGGFGLAVDRLWIERGARVLLLGESGSGKSTLLSLICGIATAQAGRVAVCGTDLASLSRATRDRFRAETVGIVFQQFNLLPYASPMDNILLPLRFAPGRRARAGDAMASALALTDALGLPREAVRAGSADRLSVGQQQRVAVARALIGQPPVIVADEPTSALDAGAQAGFLNLLFAQCEAAGATLVMVSHDERLAPRFDRSLRMADIVTPLREAAA